MLLFDTSIGVMSMGLVSIYVTERSVMILCFVI